MVSVAVFWKASTQARGRGENEGVLGASTNGGANVTVSRTHAGFSLCFQIISTLNRFEVKQGGALFSDTCEKQWLSGPPKFKINQKATLGRRPSGHAASGGVGVPIELPGLRSPWPPHGSTSLSY